MHTDVRGLALTTTDAGAASAFDRTMDHYFEYRLATGKQLKEVLEADPDFALAHCMKGYLFMLFGSDRFTERARASGDKAAALAEAATWREQMHVKALEAWRNGAIPRACAVWDEILFEHPLDLLALRLHHFNAFWMGRSLLLRDTVASVLDAWDESTPGYGYVLGMLAFGLEECGDYTLAEEYGRRAVGLNPDDLWAIHAVAHVLEMQGRLEEGSRWLDYPPEQWDDRNPFRGHLWWHAALFALEGGDYDRVLALYDRSIREANTEFYLDVQNMASLLYRLGFLGVDVGDRWEELADHAETRVGDHALAFTDAHCMMALAGGGRADGARHLLASLERFSDTTDNFAATTVQPVLLPLCRAILAHAENDDARAVELLLPVRHELAPIGGSHAQRDVFHQLLVEAAVGARRFGLARGLLCQRANLRPRSHGTWSKYAAVLEELGDTAGSVRARSEAQTIRQ